MPEPEDTGSAFWSRFSEAVIWDEDGVHFYGGSEASKIGGITTLVGNPWGDSASGHVAARFQGLGLQPKWFFLSPLHLSCTNIHVFLQNFNTEILKLDLKEFLNCREVVSWRDDRQVPRGAGFCFLFLFSVALSHWLLQAKPGEPFQGIKAEASCV